MDWSQLFFVIVTFVIVTFMIVLAFIFSRDPIKNQVGSMEREDIVTARKCVTDEQYGQFQGMLEELARRVDEGTIPFDSTMRALNYFIEGKFRFGDGSKGGNVANSLKSLISSGNFGYIDTNITEANFPDVGIKCEDAKVYHFDKYVSTDYAIQQMEEDDYRPANLRELLTWMIANWNGKDWVVALDQSWRGSVGGLCVPCLDGWFGGRSLSLFCLGHDWRGYCRFLAFRKSSPR